MKESILIGIITGIISSIITKILKIVTFKSPLQKHKEIYSKVKYLERNYDDIFNKNLKDNFYIGIMEIQLKLIKEIIDELYKVKDMHPIFAYLFNYKIIIFQTEFLLYYTKDPIMLKKDRMFSKDYIIDLKKYFKKLSFYMTLQYKLLLILILLLPIVYIALNCFAKML